MEVGRIEENLCRDPPFNAAEFGEINCVTLEYLVCVSTKSIRNNPLSKIGILIELKRSSYVTHARRLNGHHATLYRHG